MCPGSSASDCGSSASATSEHPVQRGAGPSSAPASDPPSNPASKPPSSPPSSPDGESLRGESEAPWASCPFPPSCPPTTAVPPHAIATPPTTSETVTVRLIPYTVAERKDSAFRSPEPVLFPGDTATNAPCAATFSSGTPTNASATATNGPTTLPFASAPLPHFRRYTLTIGTLSCVSTYAGATVP